jgi:hypothetical protein
MNWDLLYLLSFLPVDVEIELYPLDSMRSNTPYHPSIPSRSVTQHEIHALLVKGGDLKVNKKGSVQVVQRLDGLREQLRSWNINLNSYQARSEGHKYYIQKTFTFALNGSLDVNFANRYMPLKTRLERIFGMLLKSVQMLTK